MADTSRTEHIRLTSHPHPAGKARFPISWGAAAATLRGPIIASVSRLGERNVIGSHGGAYALYRALAVSSGALDPDRRPDLTNTHPAVDIGPFAQWTDPDAIVSIDPWGHLATEAFAAEIAAGIDIRPTIAVTRARLDLVEIQAAFAAGRLKRDDRETTLRRILFEQTGGMFPELVTRPDLRVFLPPIGGTTIYLFGDVQKLSNPRTPIACRVHDECSGSDVFGSDICTCRPYLVHSIEECVRMAQSGGLGIVVYFRKEGRALGEVTKFLVYNARKRQEGGDVASAYFERTECVAGMQDARFQQLMPDALHWLGVRRIDRLISMSDMKYDALVGQGIEIVERVSLPDHLVPSDAQVEIAAKKAAGYYTAEPFKVSAATPAVGRTLDK